MAVEILGSRTVKPYAHAGTLPTITESGFDMSYVSDRPIGYGLHHLVYLYEPPFGQRQVLKLPRVSHLGIRQTADTEDRNISLISKYLPRFEVPARVIRTNDGYLVTMDFITGRHLSLQEAPKYQEQLRDMLECNAEMVREAGASIDLVGLDGLKDLISLAGLWGKSYRLSNVMVAEDDSLKLTGHTILPLNFEESLVDRLKCQVVYAGNNLLLNVALARYPGYFSSSQGDMGWK